MWINSHRAEDTWTQPCSLLNSCGFAPCHLLRFIHSLFIHTYCYCESFLFISGNIYIAILKGVWNDLPSEVVLHPWMFSRLEKIKPWAIWFELGADSVLCKSLPRVTFQPELSCEHMKNEGGKQRQRGKEDSECKLQIILRILTIKEISYGWGGGKERIEKNKLTAEEMRMYRSISYCLCER